MTGGSRKVNSKKINNVSTMIHISEVGLGRKEVGEEHLRAQTSSSVIGRNHDVLSKLCIRRRPNYLRNQSEVFCWLQVSEKQPTQIKLKQKGELIKDTELFQGDQELESISMATKATAATGPQAPAAPPVSCQILCGFPSIFPPFSVISFLRLM